MKRIEVYDADYELARVLAEAWNKRGGKEAATSCTWTPGEVLRSALSVGLSEYDEQEAEYEAMEEQSQ